MVRRPGRPVVRKKGLGGWCLIFANKTKGGKEGKERVVWWSKLETKGTNHSPNPVPLLNQAIERWGQEAKRPPWVIRQSRRELLLLLGC